MKELVIKTLAMERCEVEDMADEECMYRISPANAVVKRTFDIILSVLVMAVFSPVYLVIWIMIKLEDKGPAIFSQERIGYGGQPFTIYKFRSMVQGAEEEGEPKLCRENDERLTKVGKFLRDHHIDELPQLWNVLKGDMSFVGYRPERKCFVDRIIEKNGDYELLYVLRPGLFSEATLYNGYTDTLEKMLIRLDMDLEYLKNQSFWLDVKIIVITVWSIFSGKKF